MLLALVLGSCYENQPGCLDIRATNYDVTADTECEGCCTLPMAGFNLTTFNRDTTFRLGDTIVNDLGQQAILLNLVYFISDFRLVVNSANTRPVDSLILATATDTFAVSATVARVNRRTATYRLGTFLDDGMVSGVQFDLGLPAEVSGKSVEGPASNAISTDPDSLVSEELEYTTQRLQIVVGPDLLDTIVLDVPASLGIKVVQIEVDTFTTRGQDKLVDLKVDYGIWFDDIDFTTMSQSEMAERLQSNLAQAFSY